VEREYKNINDENISVIDDLNNVALEAKQTMIELNKKTPEELRKLYERTLKKSNNQKKGRNHNGRI
jgi:hypothetical protein